jgi:protoheme IX farnesyltransferase
MSATIEDISYKFSLATKLKAYYQLTKMRLSLLVVFSSSMGYVLGCKNLVDYKILTLLAIGGFCVTASANIINQIIEKDLDKLMSRTQKRPLPSGVVEKNEAIVLASLLGLLGLSLCLIINPLTFWVSLLSLVLYAFVYTPCKRIGTIAVFVGAFPGAFPPMIGWLAATNSFGWEPGILFAIQFFWQFPHFWAIAWVLDEDYKKAGFKLLPAKGKDVSSAIQIMIYTLFLLPLCWVPYYLKMTGINSAVIALVCGILFLAQTFQLMRKVSDKAALQLMFGSFLYLPIVQIAYVLDKL